MASVVSKGDFLPFLRGKDCKFVGRWRDLGLPYVPGMAWSYPDPGRISWTNKFARDRQGRLHLVSTVSRCEMVLGKGKVLNQIETGFNKDLPSSEYPFLWKGKVGVSPDRIEGRFGVRPLGPGYSFGLPAVVLEMFSPDGGWVAWLFPPVLWRPLWAEVQGCFLKGDYSREFNKILWGFLHSEKRKGTVALYAFKRMDVRGWWVYGAADSLSAGMYSSTKFLGMEERAKAHYRIPYTLWVNLEGWP